MNKIYTHIIDLDLTDDIDFLKILMSKSSKSCDSFNKNSYIIKKPLHFLNLCIQLKTMKPILELSVTFSKDERRIGLSRV